MSKITLKDFLLESRAKTYASGAGKVTPLLPGSVQYEHAASDYSYIDTYYIGNGIFSGLETVFHKQKPVWSMSYYGDFSAMTEEQTDTLLRKALIELKDKTRLYKKIEKDFGDFIYACHGSGTFEKLEGSEEITVGGKPVYWFYYAGGFIG